MTEADFSLDRYFLAVWRAKWAILILVAAAAGATALLGIREPTFHSAGALLQVGRVWKDPLEDPHVTTEIANSESLMSELAQQLGMRQGTLKRSLSAETVTAGPARSAYPILVRITATTESADESVRLAKAVADLLISRHAKLFEDAMASHLQRQAVLEARHKEVKDGISSLDGIVKLEAELDQVRSSNTSPTETMKSHLTGEVVATGVRRPTILRNVLAAAVLALLAGVGAAVVAVHFAKNRTA